MGMQEKNIKKRNDSNGRPFFNSVVRSLKMLYGISGFYFIVSIILTFLLGVSSALTIYATKILINGLQVGVKDTKCFIIMLIIYGLINISVSIVHSFQSYISEKHRLYVDNQLDVLCLEKCKYLGLKDFEDEHIYNVITRANEMGRTKIYGMYINLLSLVESLIAILSIYIAIININKYLFLLVLIVPILSTFTNITIGKKNYDIQKKRTKKNRQLSYINYLLTNNIAIKEILNYGCHDYFIDKFKKINKEILTENNKFLKFRTLVSFTLNFFEELMSIIVIVCVMMMAKTGQLLIGDTVAYINSLTTITEKIKSLLICISTIYNEKLFIEEFFVFMDLEQTEQREGMEITEIKEIEFENVSFSYRETDRLALENISLRIDRSKPVAIIGKNGSGKTTLIKLIAGLYETYTGSININKLEMRQIDSKSYKAKLGIIFQDFNKYELSMRENIGIAEIGKLNNDEELYYALKAVDMDHAIGGNLDIQMGSWFSGRELSKGQWQRIAIARAIVKESDILVLDEPTAALDPVMEREIFRLIKEISKQKILIFITHRVSTLLEFDPYIFVMRDGKLVSQGDQQQLKFDSDFNILLTGKKIDKKDSA